MSVILDTITITCDHVAGYHCNRHISTTKNSFEEARIEAHKNGWRTIGDKDYCYLDHAGIASDLRADLQLMGKNI